MADFDLEALLAPLQDNAPCGADLEYDPAFLAMQDAGSGRPEQQYGDTVIPAQEPDWLVIRERALALAQRTRDLRVAVWLVRTGARLQGWTGAVAGLQLVQGLLERHWPQVHPQLDATDNDDPTARLNALQPLVHEAAALADLRVATLTSQRGGPRVRDVELALGDADPLPDETVPTEQGLRDAISAGASSTVELAQQLQAGAQAVQAIATAIEQRLGAGDALDFAPLMQLVSHVSALGQSLLPVAPVGVEGHVLAGAAAHPAAAAGAIVSREDVLRVLQSACEWIERNEPGHPAPLLIRRAHRLMSKNFVDIIRDLMPEGLSEVEKLAGVSNE